MSNQIVHLFNFGTDPVFKALARLTTEIMTVSRLNYCPDFLKMKNLYPFVAPKGNFNKTFDEVAFTRAQQLWLVTANSGNINILWSGGIDSTVALTALIQALPTATTITVYCNNNSIYENPKFYSYLLSQPFIILKPSSVISSMPNKNFVTGDLGDQIFGSELIFKVSEYLGFDALHAPYEDNVLRLFMIHCGDQYGTYAYDRFLPIIKECPFAIKTTFDFLWWWNFTQKWQCVKLRKNCFVGSQHELNHFYDSEEMQLWSLFNHELKLGKSLNSYKQSGKDFIFNFDKNEDYKNTKTKISSMLGSKLHYFGFYEDGKKIFSVSEGLKEISSQRLVPTDL